MEERKVLKHLKELVGSEKVKDSYTFRVSYSYDATPMAVGEVPLAVVFPESSEDVSKILKFANENKIPVFPRGAGTGLTGGAIPKKGGIVVSSEKMNRILCVEVENLSAEVEAGIITFDFQKEVEKLGLFYPPDPSSYRYSTIGGNIAENAGGPRCVKYGVTKDYVLQLEVVFPDGSVVSLGSKTVKSVAGYDLKSLVVGSEGTLCFITKARLRLIPKPKRVITISAFFETPEDASSCITGIFGRGILPSACEFMDGNSIKTVKNYGNLKIPTADALLIIEVDGFGEEVNCQAEEVKRTCEVFGAKLVKIAENEREREELWKVRRMLSPAIGRLKDNKINEDVVVPRSKLTELLSGVYKIAENYDLTVVNFGHAGDGNIHVNFMYSDEEKDKVERAIDELFELVLMLDGSITGEHGVGITKKKYLPEEAKKSLELMKKIKKLIDPNNIMNPGKVFDL